MASTVGIPAASLCINRRLYSIANVKSVSIGPAEVSNVVNWTWLSCKLTLLFRNTVPFWWIHSFVFFFQLSMLLYVCSFYRLSWTPHNELLTLQNILSKAIVSIFWKTSDAFLRCTTLCSPILSRVCGPSLLAWFLPSIVVSACIIASVLTDAL